MNIVLSSTDRTLVSLTTSEITGISNALNEICNGVHLVETEFETRMGMSRNDLRALLAALLAEPHPSRRKPELSEVWADQGAVMVRAMSVFGDPVEMGETSAFEFAEQLRTAMGSAK